ncbi:MAG TPA: hypothetical protein ENJ86_03315 [Methylothermaceae bacterium]|nr:hypothetical protein [Methylothermaceae bacterium]
MNITNITKIDSDLFSLELIGDDERGYDFLTDECLLELKQLKSPKGLLSVYLDIRPETLQTKPLLTRFKNLIKEIQQAKEGDWDRDEKMLFDAVVAEMSQRLDLESKAVQGKGLVLFASPSRINPKSKKLDYDLIKVFHLPDAPSDLVVWSQTPVLEPLLIQKDEHAETGVVLFDRESVRFFLYSMGEAAEYTLKFLNPDPFPMTKAHSWHGYGTHNHHQWQEEHYKHYLRHAATAIAKIAEKTRWKWLVLASPDTQEPKHLVDFLPKALQSKAIGYASMPMTCSLNEVRDQVAPIVRQAEINEEKATLEQWVGELERPGGLAVSGVEDTVNAAQQFRLLTLIFPADFVQKGWQCESCQAWSADLQETPLPKCPYCGSDQLIEKADIIGEIAVQTIHSGGHVEVVREPDHRSIVANHGMIGGLLRF